MNYYNENDPFAANWLRELIKVGLIPEGNVDDRSIKDIEPQDLVGFKQCHFFAGIGGWSRALELSGWDADRPVWTGSCPCQSLSCAGKGLGEKDERHLWSVFYGLIEKLRPPAVFGEQVASKDGREWFAGVRNDLEAVGYAVGAADLPAASVGSPHKRNRLFWVAQSERSGRSTGVNTSKGNRDKGGYKEDRQQREQSRSWIGSGMPTDNGVANSDSGEYQGGLRKSRINRKAKVGGTATKPTGHCKTNGNGFWHNSTFIPCADGKWRRVPGRVAYDIGERCTTTEPTTGTHSNVFRESIAKNGSGRVQENKQYQHEIEPALFPLADGLPGRVGILRGSGNAIVPQVGAEFIKAYMERI